MFTKKTVRDIDLKGKTVLLRAEYNVPLKDGKVADGYRVDQSLPTVRYILEHAEKLIICSHLGRPDGKVDPALSLRPVAHYLQQALSKPVEFVTDCGGPLSQKAAATLKPGGILMLENVRFYPGEKANDKAFAQTIADLADVLVNDAFGVDHRNEASVEAIAHLLPSVAGFLVEKEVKAITDAMENPKRPLMAIVGGAKVSGDKLDILDRFIKIADFIAIGGALANPFLVAQGFDIGDSLYDKADLPVAKEVLRSAAAEAKKRPFVFAVPRDLVVADKIDKSAPTRIVELYARPIADIQHYPKQAPAAAGKVGTHEKILDIGPASAAFIAGAVQLSQTVIWSGPLGVTETASLQGSIGPTAQGSEKVIEALLGNLGHKPNTLVGGGDTVGYVEDRGLVDSFYHVSTGGGASLELIAGHKLPGVEALQDK